MTESQQKTSEKTALPIHWITEIFKVFQSRYFSKWSTPLEGIQDRAVREWATGLYGLSGEQIKHGLDNWDSDWPPSLPEFVKCCLNISDVTEEHWQHKRQSASFARVNLMLTKNPDMKIVNNEREKLRKLGMLK